jgi:uncharacterized membrane protein YGL010W
MRTLESFIEEYRESHQHPTNILIHKICVPAIMFSVLGIVKAFPVPAAWPLWLDWASVVVFLAMIFYISLKNMRVVIAVALMIFPMLLLLEWLRPRFFLLSLAIFIVAWIGQFIGHKIEGKKPSFFKDLLFLLIGPIWTVSSFATPLGIDLKISKVSSPKA